jgi:diguanylate cyclase (GGDEF)-like protein/PAS domain S-box-containing protein
MVLEYFPVSIILFFASGLAVAIAYLAWKRRSAQGVLPFVLLNLAAAIWCFGGVFETSTLSVSNAVFWSKVQYVGIVSIPPSWLLFCLSYTGQDQWFKRRFLALFWGIPLVALVLAATNEWHGLIWSHVYLSRIGSIPDIIYEHGPFFWIMAIYSYLLLVVGALVLIGAIIRYPHLYRRQAFSLLAGILIPWIANVFYLTGVSAGIDLTPIAIILSCLILTWNIFRYQFLDLAPVARDSLVENMQDGVVVLDAHNRIVDINPAAQKMLGTIGMEPIFGQDIEGIFAKWSRLDDFKWDVLEAKAEIHTQDHPNRVIDLNLTSLLDRRKHLTGKLVVLRDITEVKRVEQAEREQRTMAETLQDTIAALNSTLNYEEVLDLILAYIERLVPHDAATIALVDEQGMVQIKRARGYTQRQLEDFILTFKVPYNRFTNWRKMVEECKPQVVTDTLNDPNWVKFPEVEWIHSYAGAPIIVKGKVIGLLNLESGTPGFFTQAHAERLQTFADQAAVAIDKAQLYAEATSRAELMSTINRIGLAITSGLDLEHILKTLHEQVRQVIPMDVFYIALCDDQCEMVSFPLWFEGGEYSQVPNHSMNTASLTGFIIQNRQTLFFPDTLAASFLPPAPFIRSGGKPSCAYVGAPLLLGERVLGVISMQSYQPNAFTSDQVHLLKTVATQASIAIENSRLFAKMEQMATIDTVTDLFNRSQFLQLATQEVERSLRYHKPLTAIMIDIDFFKRVNDTYGHAVGDDVLYNVGRLCRLSLRTIDVLGRYGGDEFAIILPETELAEAHMVSERLRLLIEEKENNSSQGIVRATASFGLASFEDTQQNLESLLACTDQALYAAKQDGRNRVKIYEQPDPYTL